MSPIITLTLSDVMVIFSCAFVFGVEGINNIVMTNNSNIVLFFMSSPYDKYLIMNIIEEVIKKVPPRTAIRNSRVFERFCLTIHEDISKELPKTIDTADAVTYLDIFRKKNIPNTSPVNIRK